MQKSIAVLIVIFVCVACGGGKSGGGDSPEIELYISLGPNSNFPQNVSDKQDEIFHYWGRTVRFSVQGLDEGINDGINETAVSTFNWRGQSSDDGTLFASHVFELIDKKQYPGGNYKFKVYVDWNDNGIFDDGDVYMSSYRVYADQDEDKDTAATVVDDTDWGSYIRYDDYDNSVIINNPLDASAGTPWIINSVSEGQLAEF